MLQPHDLLNILNLLVLHNLIMFRLADIEQFSTQGEDPKVVSSDDPQTSHGKRFGRVSFCENERAISGVFGTSIVRVGKFRQAQQARC